MWQKIADFVLRYRVILMLIVFGITIVMGYYTTKVQMSYDSTGAIPTDNPKYKVYKDFQQKFGDNGNSMVLGIEKQDLLEAKNLSDYFALVDQIKQVKSIKNVLSLQDVVSLQKDSAGKLIGKPVFDAYGLSHLDNAIYMFNSLPIYKGLIYNPTSHAYLMLITIDKQALNSKERVRIINDIVKIGDTYQSKTNTVVHYSGLPYIRTQMAEKIKQELNIFLILSLALTAIILLFIFRSFVAMLVSMLIVSIGVIWSFGTLGMLGYKISILTGVIPPLVVVIGIPNCIYFLNKYHTEYAITKDKNTALRNMISKMGIVTLFTNLTAAIGFGVFFFTKSVVLKQFGLVAGLNIMALFFVSLILIPGIFSFLKAPRAQQTDYAESPWMNKLLDKIVSFVFTKSKTIFIVSALLTVLGIVGMLRLRSVGHMVDDLPAKDKILADLRFFEKHFKGIMPLDITIDTKKKYGALLSLDTWEKVDELSTYLEAQPEIGSAISLVKGVKFVKQGYAGGGVDNYALPNSTEFGAIRPQLISAFRKQQTGSSTPDQMSKLLFAYMDSTAQILRLSVNVADIGSVALPQLIEKRIQPKVDSLFDKDNYGVNITGASITYLEGSNFIIHSLGESLLWAFAMILVCIIVLFRSPKIVLIALITNVVPLVITAGVMGWLNIPLKPSTVLVFSVALGITVDVTIRFLVNYKQELQVYNSVAETVKYTIKDTGMSIIFTSIILVAGFGVFIVSEFGGTKALGYLTSLTLFLAMIFNLTLLPALLLRFKGKSKY